MTYCSHKLEINSQIHEGTQVNNCSHAILAWSPTGGQMSLGEKNLTSPDKLSWESTTCVRGLTAHFSYLVTFVRTVAASKTLSSENQLYVWNMPWYNSCYSEWRICVYSPDSLVWTALTL